MLVTRIEALAGALAASANYFGISAAVKKKLKRWIHSGQCNSPRIRAKMTSLFNNILDSLPGKRKLQSVKALLSPVKKCTLSLAKDFSIMMHPSAIIRSHPSMANDVKRVLSLCSFQRPIPFWLAIPHWKQAQSRKLSEGAYGEVFESVRMDGTPVIIKTFPVGGQHPERLTPNLSFKDVISEITCTVYLSKLISPGHEARFMSPNFPTCYKVSCVQGKYPQRLFKAWEQYTQNSPDSSEHPRPDMYSEEQLVIAIESEFCGFHVSSRKLRSALNGLSLFTQIAVSLAIAERSHEFEHRDLHIGNVLMKLTDSEFLDYVIDGIKFSVRSCGVQATIIDFTLARIKADKNVFYVDMTGSAWYARDGSQPPTNPWLENRSMYRIMAECSDNAWGDHHPYNNILWMRYLIEQMLEMLKNRLEVEVREGEILDILKNYRDTTLFYDSATGFTYERLFHDNPLITVHRLPKPDEEMH